MSWILVWYTVLHCSVCWIPNWIVELQSCKQKGPWTSNWTGVLQIHRSKGGDVNGPLPYTGRISACVNVYWKSFLFSMITKGSTLTKPPIRTTVFFCFWLPYLRRASDIFQPVGVGIFTWDFWSCHAVHPQHFPTRRLTCIHKSQPLCPKSSTQKKTTSKTLESEKLFTNLLFWSTPPPGPFSSLPPCILDDEESFA